jgi:hypothetical protein
MSIYLQSSNMTLGLIKGQWYSLRSKDQIIIHYNDHVIDVQKIKLSPKKIPGTVL